MSYYMEQSIVSNWIKETVPNLNIETPVVRFEEFVAWKQEQLFNKRKELQSKGLK